MSNYPDNMNWRGWAASVGDTGFMSEDDWRAHEEELEWERTLFKDNIIELAYHVGHEMPLEIALRAVEFKGITESK